MSRGRRVLAGAGLCLLLTGVGVGAMPATAWAHADLQRSDPSDGSVLPVAPRTVHLQFSEAVEDALATIAVYDAKGARVDVGAPFHPAGRPAELDVALQPKLANGSYVVSW